MTRKDRKRYSREFKLEAVRRCDESGKPITQVARELDISVHHLYRWRDGFAKQSEKVFPGCGTPLLFLMNYLDCAERMPVYSTPSSI